MTTEKLFWMFALFGTLLFAARSLMIFAGLGHEGGGHDVYHDVDSASGTESSFKVFSFHTVTAFIMMFGWAGLSAEKQFELGSAFSIIIALIVGAGFMFVVALLMRSLLRLESEGAVFKIEDTVGKNGSVYERVPPQGLGRIQIHAGGMLRELQAVSQNGELLETPTPVVVVRVVDAQTVAVQAVT